VLPPAGKAGFFGTIIFSLLLLALTTLNPLLEIIPTYLLGAIWELPTTPAFYCNNDCCWEMVTVCLGAMNWLNSPWLI